MPISLPTYAHVWAVDTSCHDHTIHDTGLYEAHPQAVPQDLLLLIELGSQEGRHPGWLEHIPAVHTGGRGNLHRVDIPPLGPGGGRTVAAEKVHQGEGTAGGDQRGVRHSPALVMLRHRARLGHRSNPEGVAQLGDSQRKLEGNQMAHLAGHRAGEGGSQPARLEGDSLPGRLGLRSHMGLQLGAGAWAAWYHC